MLVPTELFNVILASTNLIAIPFIRKSDYHTTMMLLRFYMISSFIMHLSDTTHGLPGIYPLNNYNELLLHFDKCAYCILVFAFSIKLFSDLFCLQIFVAHSRDLIYSPLHILTIVCIGILSISASELLISNQLVLYTVYHLVWRLCGYYCFQTVLDKFIC